MAPLLSGPMSALVAALLSALMSALTPALPPALTPDAAARLVPIEVSLNGAFTSLDCARQPDLFDCVRDFCVGNEIEPAVQCMASLISSLQAQVL